MLTDISEVGSPSRTAERNVIGERKRKRGAGIPSSLGCIEFREHDSRSSTSSSITGGSYI